jgi:hypothetical protein
MSAKPQKQFPIPLRDETYIPNAILAGKVNSTGVDEWRKKQKAIDELLEITELDSIVERFLRALKNDPAAIKFIIQHGNSLPILDKLCQTLCQIGCDQIDNKIIITALQCVYRLRNGREYVKEIFPEFLENAATRKAITGI